MDFLACCCCDTDADSLFGGGNIKVVSSGWDTSCFADRNATFTLAPQGGGVWKYEDCGMGIGEVGSRWTVTVAIVGTAISIVLVLETLNALCVLIHEVNWSVGYACKLPTVSFDVALAGGDTICPPADNPATITISPP